MRDRRHETLARTNSKIGRKVGIGIGAFLAVVLGVAWIDGGREEPRLIEQPLDLPAGVVADVR